MLGKKMGSFKKLAKKVKVKKNKCEISSQYQESLLNEIAEEEEGEGEGSNNSTRTPNGYFAVYVGEERERFAVATSFLKHPLLKMLLEKSYNEFVGFGQEQSSKLVVPCTVSTFQEVISAVECCNGRFVFGDFVEEFI